MSGPINPKDFNGNLLADLDDGAPCVSWDKYCEDITALRAENTRLKEALADSAASLTIIHTQSERDLCRNGRQPIMRGIYKESGEALAKAKELLPDEPDPGDAKAAEVEAPS